MDKKISLVLVLPLLLLVSCSRFVSTEPIEKDCEHLKSFLPEVSIQFSQAIDEGLDMDDFLKLVKKTYRKGSAHRFKHSAVNENGINTDAFANALAWSMQNHLKRKDSHISVSSENLSIVPFCRMMPFLSDIFFEKEGDEYFVSKSNEKNLLPGMKYTGDKENLVQEYADGKVVYRYIVFSDSLPKKGKTNISLNNKQFTIPVRADSLKSCKGDDIWFEENDGVLTVVIKTMKPRYDKNIESYEVTLEKICKQINNYSTVVFDFRDNSGGYIGRFLPILTTMIYGEIDALYDDRIKLLEDYLRTGEIDILTKTIANRRLLEGQNMMAGMFYHDHKNERYYTFKEPEEKIDFSNKVFKGKIFVITNTNTCSAAEYSLAALKYIFKDDVIQLGTKTGGMLDFGGAYTYPLYESKVNIHLCFCDLSGLAVLNEDSGWRGDTEGFYPDYWFFSETEGNIKKFIMETK